MLRTTIFFPEEFNLHVTVHEQPRIQINSSDLMLPFNQLFDFLIPHIDAGKAIELQTLAYKYEVCLAKLVSILFFSRLR
jgi:hypothetical protein